jgi:hypothetical protein
MMKSLWRLVLCRMIKNLTKIGILIICLIDDSPRSEYFSWVLRKLILLIFLGLKIFYQVFLVKILMLVSTCWKKKNDF